MANHTILDQYINSQLTEQEEEAFEATLLKATFAYQEEQALVQKFAQWRNEAEQKRGKSRHLYVYGLAASFLFLVLAVGAYKFYMSKPEQINTATTIVEKPIEPMATQKDTPTSLPIVKAPTTQQQARVVQTLPPKTNEPQQTNENTTPQYLAQNDALFTETETILEEKAMDIDSNTKMGVENIESLRHIAQKYFKDKEYAKYISTIRRLDKDKIDGMDYLFLGEASLHLKDNKGAIDNFKEMEKKDFDSEPDRRNLYLAIAYIRDNQLDNARKALKIIINSKASNFKDSASKLLELLK